MSNIKNENTKYESPWTQIDVDDWINKNIIANIQNYKSLNPFSNDYWINVNLPIKKIGPGEYSYATINYLGPSLNLNMWNIDIGTDKPKIKYMLCLGGPFDKTYENQWYASEHGYKCFNQAGHTGSVSTRNKSTSVLIHEDLLK